MPSRKWGSTTYLQPPQLPKPPEKCRHEICQKITRRVRLTIFGNGGMTRAARTNAINALPYLLCSSGNWPPPIPLGTINALMDAFAEACHFFAAEGLKGQQLDTYGVIAKKLRERQQP